MRARVAVLLWCVAGTAQAACPEGASPATNEALRASLGDAEAVYATAEVAAELKAWAPVALTDLTCLTEVVDPEVARRVHLLKVVQADPFGEKTKENVNVQAGIRRLHELGGGLELAKGLLPEGHGVVAALAEPPPGVTTVSARTPAEGSLVFDGQRTLERPSDAATVFQLLDGGNVVVRTDYLLPGDPLPTYPVKSKARPVLLGIATGAGVAAAGLFGTSFALEKGFDPYQHEAGYRTTTNALGGAAVGLGSVAVGAVVGVFVIGS